MQEIILDYKNTEWKNTSNSPHGLSCKTLRDEGATRTLLLKFPEGVTIDGHKHSHTEQHFIVKGHYESDGRKYSPGYYRLIPAGTDHGPFFVKSELVILVIWETD
jgi:anti-sigma factor ChrR (cupin superfamily)